jgi:hypothetical protein
VPKLEVEGVVAVDVEEGKRLVLAIEEDAGVDILHRVGPKPQNGSAAIGRSSLSCLPDLGRI